MEDINELLIIGKFIQELYNELIKLDNNKDSEKYQKIIAELKLKIDWEDLVLQRIIDSLEKEETIKYMENSKIDSMLLCRYLTKFNLNIKENRSNNYNLNLSMGIYSDSLALALRMIDEYLEEHPDLKVTNLKYDIIFIAPKCN